MTTLSNAVTLESNEHKYGFDYTNSINKIIEANKLLEVKRQNNNISDENYINAKSKLTNWYTKTMENKIEEENLYNSITKDEDKQAYDYYVKLSSGTFDENTGYGNRVGSIQTTYNRFFENENGESLNNKTITVGKKFYNNILKTANDYGIDFNKLGIKYESGNYSFTIPKDKKSFINFADVYYQTLGNSPWNFIKMGFTNTANEGFFPNYRIDDESTSQQSDGDPTNFGKITASNRSGDILFNVGQTLEFSRSNFDKIRYNYGVDKYYIPIMSPYQDDITVDFMKELGFKNADINEQRKYINSRLMSAHVRDYEIYANENDVNNANGGSSPITRITNDKLKGEILDAIRAETGDTNKDNKINTSNLNISFATKNGVYGTMLHIPKGSGSYSVFIENLLPSRLAEMYVNNPDFQVRTQLDKMAAINDKNRIKINDIGERYSGNIRAYDNKFTYQINDGEEIHLTREEAHVLKLYSDAFRQYCISNALSKEINEHNNEEIKKFITTPHDNYGISFVDVIQKISGTKDYNTVVNNLINTFNNYYKVK